MRYHVPPPPMIPRPLTDAEKNLALLSVFAGSPSVRRLRISAALVSVRLLEIVRAARL